MSCLEISKSEEQIELLKNKTQKKKKNYSEYEKARLWSMFDKDIEKRINEKQDLNNEDMECIYLSLIHI